MKLIMLGAPGAGKGTQATVMSEKFTIPHISTGDIFRSNISKETELGKKAKEYIDKGLLVPDELVVNIVIDRLQEDDCSNGFVLDGFPRTIPQAKALDEQLKSSNSSIDYVIDVEVPDEVIIKRMAGRRVCPKCGEPWHIKYKTTLVENICDRCGENLIRREDDEPATVKKRLNVYHEQTQPLIDYYEEKGLLVEVDGTKNLKEVSESIIAALEMSKCQ